MDAASELLFRESALIKILREQRIVGLGNEFDQLVVEPGDAFFPVAIGRLLSEPATACRLIGHDFVAEHVQNLVKSRPGIYRYVHWKYTWTVLRTSVGHDVVKLCVLLIDGVYDDDFRYAAFGGVVPNAFGTYADAVLRVNDDKRNVRYAQRRERLAHEIEVARRIHDVEFLLHPRRVEQRGLRRDLPLPFAYVVVRDGRAVGDTSHAADSAATGQHRLAEQRLAGRRVPDNGKVADVRGRMRCHNPQDEAEMAYVQVSREKSSNCR